MKYRVEPRLCASIANSLSKTALLVVCSARMLGFRCLDTDLLSQNLSFTCLFVLAPFLHHLFWLLNNTRKHIKKCSHLAINQIKIVYNLWVKKHTCQYTCKIIWTVIKLWAKLHLDTNIVFGVIMLPNFVYCLEFNIGTKMTWTLKL